MDDLQQISTVQAVQGEKIDNIESTCGEIMNCLKGNGNPGLMIRTDRLEQRDAFKTKLCWILASAIVGLIVKMVSETWDHICAIIP
jgi:hypothetical protein